MPLIFKKIYSNQPATGGWKSFCCVILCATLCHAPFTYAVEQTSQLQTASVTAAKLSKLSLTQQEQAWLASHRLIRVGVRHGYMPVEYISEGNQFRGITADHLYRLERLLGVTFKQVDIADLATPDSIDMLSAVINPESIKNNGFVLLNKPYLSFPYAIYTHKNNTDIHNLASLHDKRIAVFQKNATASQLMTALPTAKLVNIDITEDAFTALERQTVDAYVGNEMIADYVANIQGVSFIKKTGYTPYQTHISMAVRSDWPELKMILQKSLLALQPEQAEILKKWDLTSHKKSEYLWQLALGALLIVISLILFRGYRFRQVIKAQNQLSQERIWHQANFDFLTNLPNRLLFHDRLQEEIKKSNLSRLPLGLLFLDLDNFKQINDQFGHAFGDQLIIKVAERIKRCVRAMDTTARVGGDEFTVIMGELADLDAVEKTSHKILSHLADPFCIDNQVIHVTASIGITTFPNDTDSIEELLVFADQAMYEAKKLGRNRYQLFTTLIREASTNKHAIMADLRTALTHTHTHTHNQFVLFYQAIIDLNNLAVYQAEALLRWQHPSRGWIEPSDFIPLAEETGMINQLGDWIFKQALKDVVDLRATQAPDFKVSINVSPMQFMNGNQLLSWLTYLHKQGLQGDVISIEITEGLLLQSTDAVKQILSEFIAAGIGIAIDDFGTGYSALSYLKKFNVHYVKLDKSFIRNIESEHDNLTLCEAIISMAHKLGIKVIAEGIETPAQQALLTQLGCDFGQGYLITEPKKLESFKEFLASTKVYSTTLN